MSDADPRIAADTGQGAAMEFGASIFFTNYPITPLDLPLTRRTAGSARACNWRQVGKRLRMPLFRRGCRSAHHPTPPLLDLAREVCVTASRPTHRQAPRAKTRRSQISYAAANAPHQASRSSRDFFDTIRPRQSSDLKNHNTDVRFLYLLPLRVVLEEDKGPYHDVLAASGVRRGGRIDAGGMERPARDGAVGHRVIAFEH